MLTFNKFKKSYHHDIVVGIENRTLSPGVYWISGENGSGKSTLLKCIAGIIPYEGAISCYGIFNNNKDGQTFRKIVNYAEAEPQYPEFLKGEDLIQFYKKTKGATNEHIANLLNKLKVESYVDRKIGEYSSGMIKKLSLALAFFGAPRLILLDEPLITLDKEATINIMLLIKEYSLNGGSVILTSHQAFSEKAGIHFNKLLLNNHQLETIA